MGILDEVGIPYFKPQGAYYAFCDISSFGYRDDLAMTKYLVKDIGVAVVPGSSFFGEKEGPGQKYIRFCFSRQEETLKEARTRLLKMKEG